MCKGSFVLKNVFNEIMQFSPKLYASQVFATSLVVSQNAS